MKRKTLVAAVWLAAAVSFAAGSDLKYTITVSKFENEAGWSGRWDLGNGFATIMTDQLQKSGRFIVLGDAEMRGAAMAEQDLADSGRTAKGKKAPKTGRLTPAQLLVRGSITHVQDSTTGGSGGINFRGVRLGGSGDAAQINMTVYLVDSETGQVKASADVIGKSGRKGLAVGYSGSALGGLTGDMEGFAKDNVGKATQDAVAQCITFLTKQIETIPWEGSVASAKDGKIIINRGTRDGVNVGDSFTVGAAEDVVDDDTGEVLDRTMTKVATITVTEVKEKVAYCTAGDGGDKIAKGMTVMPAK